MNNYARFKNQVIDAKGNIFNQSINNDKLRYAIVDETSEHVHVAIIPDDIECKSVSKFKKVRQREFFNIVQE